MFFSVVCVLFISFSIQNISLSASSVACQSNNQQQPSSKPLTISTMNVSSNHTIYYYNKVVYTTPFVCLAISIVSMVVTTKIYKKKRHNMEPMHGIIIVGCYGRFSIQCVQIHLLYSYSHRYISVNIDKKPPIICIFLFPQV